MEITTWSHNSRQKCLWSIWTVCFCLCARVRIKKKTLFEMTFCVVTVFTTRGDVCCRDAANIKGGLEHLVSSIWHPPFTPKVHTHTHAHMRTLSCAPSSLISALVMKPPERELNTGSWQAGREGGNAARGRLAPPPGSGPSLILAFHLFPILYSRAGSSLCSRSAADTFLMWLYLFADG